jgi:hypothetical protein
MPGTHDSPQFSDDHQLVDRLAEYFAGEGSLDDVRDSTAVISRALYTGTLPPQRLIVTLETALRCAATRAGVAFGTHDFRVAHGELTRWLIETCFAGIDELP